MIDSQPEDGTSIEGQNFSPQTRVILDCRSPPITASAGGGPGFKLLSPRKSPQPTIDEFKFFRPNNLVSAPSALVPGDTPAVPSLPSDSGPRVPRVSSDLSARGAADGKLGQASAKPQCPGQSPNDQNNPTTEASVAIQTSLSSPRCDSASASFVQSVEGPTLCRPAAAQQMSQEHGSRPQAAPQLVHGASASTARRPSPYPGPNERASSTSISNRDPGSVSVPIVQASHPATSKGSQADGIPHLDKALHALRFALITEQVKAEHAQSEQLKKQERLIQSLIDTNCGLVNDATAQKAVIEQLKRKLRGIEQRSQTAFRYLRGLGTDFDRIKKEAREQHANAQGFVDAHVSRLESSRQQEREELAEQFRLTLNAVEKNQKATKHLLDECVTKLTHSEAVRKALADDIERKEALMSDERKRATNLESQLLEIVGRHGQSEDDSRACHGKLESISAALQEAKDDRHACLGILQDLQKAPLQPANDAERLEEAIRTALDRWEVCGNKKVGRTDCVLALVPKSKTSPVPLYPAWAP